MRREGSTIAVRDRFERLPLARVSFARAANLYLDDMCTFVSSAAS